MSTETKKSGSNGCKTAMSLAAVLVAGALVLLLLRGPALLLDLATAGAKVFCL